MLNLQLTLQVPATVIFLPFVLVMNTNTGVLDLQQLKIALSPKSQRL